MWEYLSLCCGSCAENWKDYRAFDTLRELPARGEMINFDAF